MPKLPRSWARVALAVGAAARWASRITGRGGGAMIGGLVTMSLEPSILEQLGSLRYSAIVTGTNGKTTTTRMLAAALGTMGAVATNSDGANMEAGLVAAFAANLDASMAALEVDEMHVARLADLIVPKIIVLLNLSRDQLDRVGEVNHIEQSLRVALSRLPDTVVIANCDDVLITSAAYKCPNVVWVSGGSRWLGDSVICPRSGGIIIREGSYWCSSETDLRRPVPQWWFDDRYLYGPNGLVIPMHISLPGIVNRGNAAMAVAAAVEMGVDPATALQAAALVDEVAGRYRTVQVEGHTVRHLLAKNPASWQEAMSMLDKKALAVVIAVNGQVPDGVDLSWLWDINFEVLRGVTVVVTGERATDLAVRLRYAGINYSLVHNPLKAIDSCPPGHIEVVSNYSAFLSLRNILQTTHG